MKSVSIIIPIYNTENFLCECIDSVLKQTYSDFELILVNDGSTDACPSICDKYAKLDSRIVVVHKNNGGISDARNAGLDIATGKYIVFIDSDDYVKENYLYDLIKASKSDDTLVCSSYLEIYQGSPREQEKLFSGEVNLNALTKEQYEILHKKYYIWCPYCKLYSKRIIDDFNLRYDVELESAEDMDFNRRYIPHVKKLHFIPNYQYCYRIAYKKITPKNTFINKSRIKSVHLIFDYMMDFAKRGNIFDEVEPTVAAMNAEKLFFSRMPSVFSGDNISLEQRKRRFKELISYKKYFEFCQRYVCGNNCTFRVSKSMRTIIKINNFYLWFIYYIAWRVFRKKY